MPKPAVEKQLHEEITKYNNQDGRGHLVADALFAPQTCHSFWIRFKPSLGKSEEDQGNSFRKHLLDNKVVPIGSHG